MKVLLFSLFLAVFLVSCSNSRLHELDYIDPSSIFGGDLQLAILDGAKMTDDKGYEYFALLRLAPKYNGLKIKNGEVIQPKVKYSIYMFNEQSEKEQIKNLSSRKYKYKILGFYKAKDYKGKRFVPIGNMPGIT